MVRWFLIEWLNMIKLDDSKLYIRITCISCHGSRAYSAGGYHDPLNPGKWGACPYCDFSGKTYIEASVDVLVYCLASMQPDRRDLILQKLATKISEEIK
jgi:hypothetical protein